ncbi:hypothetical protein IMG5_107630, partial [Ichthyophthirius multifiliis]
KIYYLFQYIFQSTDNDDQIHQYIYHNHYSDKYYFFSIYYIYNNIYQMAIFYINLFILMLDIKKHQQFLDLLKLLKDKKYLYKIYNKCDYKTYLTFIICILKYQII